MTAAVWGPVVTVLVLELANLIAWAANENSRIFKRCLKPLGVRPLLFISNRAACVGKHARPISYWAFDLLDPSHLVKSNCLSTPMLLVLHALTFLYWVIFIIVDVAIEYYRVWCDAPTCGRRYGAYGEWASYLTNWSVSILGIAGLVALVNTARQLGRERAQRRQHQHGQHLTSGNATGAAEGAGMGDGRRKVNAGSLAPDHNSARDSQQHQHQQLSVQPVVLPTNAGDLQLASITHNQQAGAAVNPHTSAAAVPAAAAEDDEPGCCLSPRSRHAKSNAAGHHRHSSAPAGTGTASDTVVMLHDAGSSEGSSSSNAGQADCRQELKQKWDCLSCAHCIVMEVATTAAFFVSFWYWVGIVAIAGSGFSINGGTLMGHAGNVVVALLQVMLTRLPIVSYHFQVLLWYATLYCIFLWIYAGASDIWRYGLDFQQPRPAGVYIILPIVTFAMFLLWYFAAVIREGVLLPAKRKVTDRQNRHKEQRHQRHAQQQLAQHHNSSVQQGSVQRAAVPPGNGV